MWVAERNTIHIIFFSSVLVYNPGTISLDQGPNFCQSLKIVSSSSHWELQQRDDIGMNQ